MLTGIKSLQGGLEKLEARYTPLPEIGVSIMPASREREALPHARVEGDSLIVRIAPRTPGC
jgi:hypothetical protein